MKTQIACKFKNSFAIDSKEDLYSWGSYEHGLLGYDEQIDITTPSKITFEKYGEEYNVESISIGHFHAGAICKLKNYQTLNLELTYEANKICENFRNWYNKTFVWELSDVKNFCKGMLKINSFNKTIAYKDIKEYLLDSFLEFMKNNKQDSFNMLSFYETNLKTVFGISEASDVSIKKFEKIFSAENKNNYTMTVEEKNITRFVDFLNKSFEHLKRHKDDLPFFIRFATKFKKKVKESDIKKILEFCKNNSMLNEYEIKNNTKSLFDFIYNQLYSEHEKKGNDSINNPNIKDNVIVNNNNTPGREKDIRVNLDNNPSANNANKNDKFLNKNKYNNNNIENSECKEKEIPVCYLIDLLCNSNIGEGIVFTWGANCDGRLGYKIIQDINTELSSKNTKGNGEINDSDVFNNKTNNNYIMNLNQLQIIPKMINFESLLKIEKIACGYTHSLALTTSGRVFSWGNGKYGCLGNSDKEVNDIPSIINLDYFCKEFIDINSIGAGMYYSIASDKKGNLYSWGCGINGRLGHGDEHSVNKPKLVEYFLKKKITIKSFDCGDTHTAIIDNSDSIFTWGSGTYGKLGHGNYEDYNIPIKIEVLKNSKIDFVSCGSNDTIALTSDLKVFCCGKNSCGLLGTNQPPDKNIIVPSLMNLFLEDAKLGIVEVSVGSMHILIKLSNGDIFTCGNSVNGISGIPNQIEKIFEPKKIPKFKCKTEEEDPEDYKNLIPIEYNLGFTLKTKELKKSNIIYVVCSQDNTAYLTQNGDLFMSGKKNLIYSSDKLSNINFADSNITEINNMTSVNNINNKNKNLNDTVNLKIPQTDETFNRGMTGYGNLSTPGNAKLRDLGTPGLSSKIINTRENNNEELNNMNLNANEKDIILTRRIVFNQKVTYIAIGKTHSILVSEYKAYSWGSHENGVLGLGDIKEKVFEKPTLIEKLPSNIRMVCCSDSHSMALTMNGEVYAFGLNIYGKLGIGSMSKYIDFISKEETEDTEKLIDLPIEYEPQLVKDITFAYYISCGNNHSTCIMKKHDKGKNTIFTWGSGYAGKLANGNPNKDVCTPHAILGKENIHYTMVSCGDQFTLALDYNGYLYGSGKNIYLGINSQVTDITSTLRLLDEKNTYKFISSSNLYSIVLDKKGKMWGFGKIFREKLEIDLVRKEIMCLDKMKLVSCGMNHFSSISSSKNNVYTWGKNSFNKCGQDFDIGKNMKESKLKFVEVPSKLKLENFENFDMNIADQNDDDDDNSNMDNKNVDSGYDDLVSNGINKNSKRNFSDNCEENIEEDNKNNSDKGNNDTDINPKIKNKNSENVNSNKNKRGDLQRILLEENLDKKNKNLMEEDSKLISSFYESFSYFINNLRNTEEVKTTTFLDTENNILKFINNLNGIGKYKKYISKIPKIINMNFQIFESFFNIIQQHPCYLADVLKHINSKKIFDYIIKIIYGSSCLIKNDQRVNNLFLGLWNNLYSDKSTKNNIKNEDNISYRIYKVILNNSDENLFILRELISEIFVFYVNEISLFFERNELKGKKDIGNDSNLCNIYNESLEETQKDELQKKAVENICKKILNYFGDIIEKSKEDSSINKNNSTSKQKFIFTKHIIWIYKNLIVKEYKEMNYPNSDFSENEEFFDNNNIIYDEYLSTLNQNLYLKKQFNNYLFSPFAELLDGIINKNDHSGSPTKEITLLINQIILFIEKFKKRYSKIYNLYKLDPFFFKKNYINDLFSNNSSISKDIYKIFLRLSNSDFQEINPNMHHLKEMNYNFSTSLRNFKWDFTLDALKDIIKSSIDRGNFKLTLPISIDELISLQNYFKNFMSKKTSEDDKDPLNNILTQISNFKLTELDNTSSIRNIILNIEVKPLTYIFDFNNDSKIIKCPKCLLPLDDRFFSDFNEKKLENIIYGSDWFCSENKKKKKNINKNSENSDNDDEGIICRVHRKQDVECKVVRKYKNKENIISKNDLFKKYYVKNNDKLLNLYEEVLYILPKMSEEEELLKTVKKEKEAINSMNSKNDEWKSLLFEDFITLLETKLRNSDLKNKEERKKFFDNLDDLLEFNLIQRKEHQKYTLSIMKLIQFMSKSGDQLKTKLSFFEKENYYFNAFVKKGTCNQLLFDKTEKSSMIKSYQQNIKKVHKNMKYYKYNVITLVNDRVISGVKVKEGTSTSEFYQKSYLTFSKNEKGYQIKFSLKDTQRKYIFCGIEDREYVLNEFILDYKKIKELRRTAKNNPTITLGEIRFNVFYLVYLVNSFENINS